MVRRGEPTVFVHHKYDVSGGVILKMAQGNYTLRFSPTLANWFDLFDPNCHTISNMIPIFEGLWVF